MLIVLTNQEASLAKIIQTRIVFAARDSIMMVTITKICSGKNST
jgi:hypothetical protein